MAKGSRLRSIVVWTAVALVGAVAWGVIALVRGEQISAAWLIAAARRLLRDRLPLLRALHRRTRCSASTTQPRHARRAPRQRRRLPADRPARAVRPPLRRDRRRRAARRARARRADGLPAGHDLDRRRRHLRRRRAGHGRRCSSRCAATARALGQMARDEIGPVGGAAALIAVLRDHDHPAGGARAGRRQRAGATRRGARSRIAMTIPIALFMGFYMRVLRPGPRARGDGDRRRAAAARDRRSAACVAGLEPGRRVHAGARDARRSA